MTPVTVTIGEVTRELPTIRVGAVREVPLVEFLGDPQFTNVAAEAMLPLLPKGTELLLTVETNALPLVHELADRAGLPYLVARKRRRTYMRDPIIQDVPSMTMGVGETLWLDGRHAGEMKGKKVAIVQDVVASGGSALALTRMADRIGAEVLGYLAAFKQGSTNTEFKLEYLQELEGVQPTTSSTL